VTVDSAKEAAPFARETSIAPPLILSASCECVGDANAIPPSISVSDMMGVLGAIDRAWLGNRIVAWAE